jgi:serine/threonine protein kinase
MQQLGKYELLAKIASGGMAEIWVARTRSSGYERVCVVKRLLPQHEKKEDYINMFLDEGRIAAALNHPNVVQTYDFGSENGTHYLAMEYLHGEDLRTILRLLKAQGRTMPLEHATNVVIQACAGLHHAHEAKDINGVPLEIVHRDVSPHNVFVTFEGAAKIVDFGIAKSQGREWETRHGTLKGKVPYMSPEQVKGKKLDRRSDIYALGVMLYELTLGRRPYVLAAAGDFAMMMAIARHDVRAPTLVDSEYPSDLERIILTAMAYDAKSRYATAREMQADLEQFARKQGFATSTLALSQYMASLFGDRVEKWREAKQRDLAAHVVKLEEERANSSIEIEEDFGDASTEIEPERTSMARRRPNVHTAPLAAVAAFVASSAAVASVDELLGVTVVTLHGKIDERFEGARLAGALKGTVLIDSKGVERITSFGVREWLEMMKTFDEGGEANVWLSRCSEPIITQLSLIKTFAGKAKVVSFDAPFLCDDCGTSFTRLIDCERDADVILGKQAASAKCPQCGGSSKLDEDAAYLEFARPFAGLAVPEKVKTLVASLEQRDGAPTDVVDKLVVGEETRLRVRRPIERNFRWNRVLDGIEGALVVDFRGVPRFTREAAEALARALRGLGSDVKSCEIVEAPVAVAEAVARDTQSGRIVVSSIAFEGRCTSCAATRSGVIARRELEHAWAEKRTPFVPCRRCDAPLALSDLEGTLRTLFGEAETPSASLAVTREAEPARPSAAKPAANRFSRIGTIAAAALALAVVGVAATRAREPQAPPPAISSATPAPPLTAEAFPIERRPDGLYVRVQVKAADEDAALANARVEAVATVAAEVERDLPGPVRDANAALPAVPERAVVAEHFARQVGAIASPERVDVKMTKDGGAVELTARYRLATDAFERVVSHYGATRELDGVTLAQAVPTRGDGLVVVAVAPRIKGLSPGALLVSVDGRPRATLDALSRVPGGRYDVVFSTGSVTVPLHLSTR